MKVLILGASGFIGLPAAQALVRTGHQVYGLTRSEEKGRLLAADEIIPVISEVSDFDKWVHLAAGLDAIIDAVGGSADIRILSASLLSAVSTAAASLRPAGAPKLAYIYTSGTWVHGEDRENTVTDTTPCTHPAELVAWRVGMEQKVLEDTVLNGIVVRPALLYGRSGSLLAPLFDAAMEAGKWNAAAGNKNDGIVRWTGRAGGRYAAIHTDDLADLYLRVCERAALVGGRTFDVANDNTESVDDFLGALARLVGAKGYAYTEPSNLYEEALGTTTLIRPYLARALLGWQPRKAGLVDGLSAYYQAYLAARS
jgi:nucleoside-diphosphate-sugar epimerase